MVSYGVQSSPVQKGLLDVVKITVGPRGRVEYEYVARGVKTYKAVDILQKSLYSVLQNIRFGYDFNTLEVQDGDNGLHISNQPDVVGGDVPVDPPASARTRRRLVSPA
jgi:hypothetical protein